MGTSIFTKLSNASRHKHLFDDLPIGDNAPTNTRQANTVGGFAGFGLHLKCECAGCKAKAVFSGKELVKMFGADRLLKDARFGCKTCNGTVVSTMPVSALEPATGKFKALPAPKAVAAPAPEKAPARPEKPVKAAAPKKPAAKAPAKDEKPAKGKKSGKPAPAKKPAVASKKKL